MSVRNVGVPVIVTVAFSNVRSANTSCTAAEPFAKRVERGVADEHRGQHRVTGVGDEGLQRLANDELAVGWCDQLVLRVDGEAVVAEERGTSPMPGCPCSACRRRRGAAW